MEWARENPGENPEASRVFLLTVHVPSENKQD